MQLRPHPRSTYPRPLEIDCDIHRGSSFIVAAFELRSALNRLVIPDLATAERKDDLWRHTCFELFLRPAGQEGYHEFNMSPSGAWAAYQFEDYRAGMRNSFLELLRPVHVERGEHSLRQIVFLDPGDDPGLLAEVQVGVSAVVEATDGSRSYWALTHSDGPPDFHDPTCFVAALPPIA